MFVKKTGGKPKRAPKPYSPPSDKPTKRVKLDGGRSGRPVKGKPRPLAY